MSRSCLLEVIGEDFVRTARAKGLREGIVVMRHALPNALLPVITISGVLLGFVLGGSVAVEQAFGVPGRSEEHTSELQSLAYLVCRLLLEKKKKLHQFRTRDSQTPGSKHHHRMLYWQ